MFTLFLVATMTFTSMDYYDSSVVNDPYCDELWQDSQSFDCFTYDNVSDCVDDRWVYLDLHGTCTLDNLKDRRRFEEP